MMRLRYGENFAGSTQAIALRRGRSSSASTQVTFHPAGHVLGSAQIAVSCGGIRIVASGDYKDVADPTCAPFETVPCDVFITEATFGLPVFRHGDPKAEIAKLLRFRGGVSGTRASGRRLFARQGATRHRACCDRPATTRRSICTARWRRSPAITKAAASTLGELRLVKDAKKAELAGTITLAPPSATADLWTRRFPDPVTAFASGWMRVRARARQRGIELPLVISDHADWDGLCATIAATGAGEIWVTHGQEDALVHWCTAKGLTARPLALVGYGDEDEEAALPLPAQRRKHESLRRTARSSLLRARPQQQAAADHGLFSRDARSGSRLCAGGA